MSAYSLGNSISAVAVSGESVRRDSVYRISHAVHRVDPAMLPSLCTMCSTSRDQLMSLISHVCSDRL